MRLLLPVVVALVLASRGLAGPPPGLTAADAAAGWVALFDGESAFGWAVDGDARVDGGELVLGGEGRATRAEATLRLPGADVRVSATGTGPIRPRLTAAGRPPEVGDGVDAAAGPADGPVLSADVPAGGQLRVRSAAARPTGLKPLFNGNDLSGWRVFAADPARNKATFAVTPAGELHVTGGPGDLQSEARFADLVFQAEVRTAGPTVNSGVFLRCVPGQFQNGYEVQVQNAVVGGDRTNPLDFGTGAIYRRVKARKVVAADGDWFALTVVAVGPRLATWVDGHPVVDWVDDRPPDDNPRKGRRTAAGPLSIQGHGPPMVADVKFRNLRAAELAVGRR